jgi:DNA-binding NtrC family response regulator
VKARLSALLVYDHDDGFFETVKGTLEALSVRTLHVRTCNEAGTHLGGTPPHIALTDPVLTDGDWRKVLELAASAPKRVNVIVASRVGEVSLYLDAMTEGAFDFVTYSFSVPELVHVLVCALDNAARSRDHNGNLSIGAVTTEPLNQSLNP